VWSEPWCTGQNTLKQIIKNSFNSEIVRPSHRPIKWTFCSSPFTAERASANSSLMLVWTTPSQVVLKLSGDNKMPASSDFTPRQRISPLGWYLANRANGGLSLCLCCRFKSWTYAASVMLWGIVS
jgi:hypothetical protein